MAWFTCLHIDAYYYNIRHVVLFANWCFFISKCLCTLFMKKVAVYFKIGLKSRINSKRECLGEKQRKRNWGWKDGSMVKCMYCSLRRSEQSSQQSHMPVTTYNSSYGKIWYLWFLMAGHTWKCFSTQTHKHNLE